MCCWSISASDGCAGSRFPLRIYLSAFPEIAAQGEMVRALVDGERARAARRSWGRLTRRSTPNTLDVVSEDSHPADRGGGARGRHAGRSRWRPPKTAARSPLSGRADRPGSTRIPTQCDAGPKNSSRSRSMRHYHLQSEAETLRTMLNTVRFTLVRRLGAGGMGVVYETYDQQRGELVALKTMRRVDPGALVRFKQEFRSLSDITHPNLVNLYELFAVEDRWFFTMELVEGCNFLSLCEGTPEAAAARWNAEPTVIARPARSAAQSSPAAQDARTSTLTRNGCARHSGNWPRESALCTQAGKLHRDIKPPNVLVTLEGRVVLLDFGLTADLESVGTERQVVGTIGHMSPEQAAGESVSTASDWYSVGVMLLRSDDRPASVCRHA